jgi:hypothetical protein
MDCLDFGSLAINLRDRQHVQTRAQIGGSRASGNRHGPGNKAPSPRATAVASCLSRRCLRDRRRISSHHAHQRIRATILRAMKRAMKSTALIGQINRDAGRQLARYPELLGAPGRIRTCAPASGGRLINPSGTAIDPYGHIQTLRSPRILSGAHRFIAQTIARVAVATGLCARHLRSEDWFRPRAGRW